MIKSKLSDVTLLIAGSICKKIEESEDYIKIGEVNDTKSGYDIEFTRAISDAVILPVIASGGAGTLEHFYQGVVEGGANILLAASVFHFRILSIEEVKKYLKEKGLKVKL